MEILLAKSAGFCFGVQRAVDTAYEHADEENVYTYGQIIHNEEVVGDLTKHGVQVIDSDDELLEIKDSKVIIRSHGAEKRIYDILEAGGNTVIDATCPFVKKIHNIVREEGQKGNTVVIIGDSSHPEVKGIVGWCVEPPVVIGSEEEAEAFVRKYIDGEVKTADNISIVSQTTFNYRKFNYIVDIIRNKLYNVTAYKTICNASASAWDTLIPVLPIIRESLLRPSTINLPSPYPPTYIRANSPLNFLCFLYINKNTSSIRFHKDSYRNVGWTVMQSMPSIFTTLSSIFCVMTPVLSR